MTWVDWVVLAMYAGLMLGIGWYYSRQNQSAEDYFVGGRKMSPVLVGLSLFSTLVSTLTYLAWPGEIIANGPMLLSEFVAYPLVFLIAGYALIPLIMRQPVTSAYEILEKRLGIGIRKAGAGAFLLLRLGWMATILYATSSLVLVPMLSLSHSWTPLLCIILGILTVIYSSEGGIRAVVMTDAVQSITMLFGAIVTLGVISVKMGGILAWWPSHWPENWPTPNWGFDPSSRLSFGTVVFSTLIWYVCTNGSDQMVIQRFLSTRDAAAARKTLSVSLITGAIVGALLALTGVALLSFYLAHPQLIPAGKTVVSAGDVLFSKFIMTEMPSGLSGVVLAAILSAAMSSLSSGINSTCAVLDRDFLSGLEAADASVSRMKRLSWVIGVIAVGLSLLSTMVQGNLIERCFKIVNLLTAPIFVLFFLALFIPFANAAGAWLGLIASIAAAVAIAYSPELGLNLGVSFMWMMPVSLFVGVTVGTLVSFIFDKCCPGKIRISDEIPEMEFPEPDLPTG
ncbi:sodium:solute symporter family transporter [Planctomicrobium sp. SH661]|uniref:sodium:solute symporter family transporter n=1 Tax=Planctomicrobium sp. SH661 TaxID=3448124 RepID=UPI003F5B6E1D